jgi:alpha(1,3/1,4) fucosyltransferase
MNKIVSIVTDSFYQKNRLFELSDSTSNRDNCLYPYWLLKQNLESHNITLLTHDLADGQEELIIFNDLPKSLNPYPLKSKKVYALLFESELIKPHNWVKKNHHDIDKIFTWHDPLVDNRKYFKFQFPQPPIPKTLNLDRKVFCTLISGNKFSRHTNELYTKRLDSIKYFSLYLKDQFQFYGMGWNILQLSFLPNSLNKVLKKLKIPNLYIKENTSFKGEASNKHHILSESLFSICYENAQNIDGYITEKIFDCFFAKCIPIYWGPQNISSFIPENTFINRKLFKNDQELLTYLHSLTQEDIFQYRDNINHYLQSDLFYQFTAEAFAEKLATHIIEDLK